MSTVTISGAITNYHGPTNVEARLYVTKPFKTTDDEWKPKSSPHVGDDPDVYQVLPTSYAANVLTFDATTIDSTTDGTPNDSTYEIYLFDLDPDEPRLVREPVLSGFAVSPIPATTTLGVLAAGSTTNWYIDNTVTRTQDVYQIADDDAGIKDGGIRKDGTLTEFFQGGTETIGTATALNFVSQTSFVGETLQLTEDADIDGDANVAGDGDFGGTVTAAAFVGDASGLVNVPSGVVTPNTLAGTGSVGLNADSDGNAVGEITFSIFNVIWGRIKNSGVAEFISNVIGKIWDKGGQVHNVKAYGATGDGVTDDTAAILLAIAAIATAGSGVLYFPTGVYLISDELTLPSAITVMGVGSSTSGLGGAESCQIKQSATNKAIFLISGDSSGIKIRDLNLRATTTTGTIGIKFKGLTADPAGAFRIEDVFFKQLEKAISVETDGAGDWQADSIKCRVHIAECLYGFYLNSGNSYGWTIEDSTIAAHYGVYAKKVGRVVIRDTQGVLVADPGGVAAELAEFGAGSIFLVIGTSAGNITMDNVQQENYTRLFDTQVSAVAEFRALNMVRVGSGSPSRVRMPMAINSTLCGMPTGSIVVESNDVLIYSMADQASSAGPVFEPDESIYDVTTDGIKVVDVGAARIIFDSRYGEGAKFLGNVGINRTAAPGAGIAGSSLDIEGTEASVVLRAGGSIWRVLAFSNGEFYIQDVGSAGNVLRIESDGHIHTKFAITVDL